jgi:hypothetical protein
MNSIKHKNFPNAKLGVTIFPDRKRYNLVFINEKGYWTMATFRTEDHAKMFSYFLSLMSDKNLESAFEFIDKYPDNAIKDETHDA